LKFEDQAIMKADYLSYSRASSVSLLGLLLQLITGLVLFIYAVIVGDHAALSGAILILGGSVVWLCLAVVFDQHRRERVEAVEAESLAGTVSRQASVFETNADDLRLAAKRLSWMHRILIPTVGIILAISMMGLGAWRLQSGLQLVDPDRFQEPTERGWALALGLGLALIGFIFGRFTSGMAKQKVWANLRAGASASVATALVGLALAAGHLVHLAGPNVVLRVLQVAIPGFMIFLGAETVLNFLLDLYRPRRAGEVPRPAFDSRVLSFIASPDRIAESLGGAINYQFGVDVTGSWAYRLLSRSVLGLVLIGAAVLWLLTGLEQIEPHERAIRVRMGANAGEVGPGMYLKLPYPLEVLDSEGATSVRRMDLMTGKSATDGPILWTNEHKVTEVYALVQPTPRGLAGAATAAGAQDIALVAVEIPLVWRIKDLGKFEVMAAPAARENFLAATARREIMRHMAGFNEDELLGRGRAAISDGLQVRVQQRFDELNTGVEVVFCKVEGVHPEREAAKVFEKVVENEQKGQGAIESGQTERIKTLTEAVGSVALAGQITQELAKLRSMSEAKDAADAIAEQTIKVESLLMQSGGKAGAAIEAARSERWTKHMLARGRADGYFGQLAAYRAAPALYRAGLYFEMLRDVMKDARVFITTDEIPDLRVNMDLKDTGVGTNVLSAPTPDQQ